MPPPGPVYIPPLGPVYAPLPGPVYRPPPGPVYRPPLGPVYWSRAQLIITSLLIPSNNELGSTCTNLRVGQVDAVRALGSGRSGPGRAVRSSRGRSASPPAPLLRHRDRLGQTGGLG